MAFTKKSLSTLVSVFFVGLVLALSRTLCAYHKLRHRYATTLLMRFLEAKERQRQTFHPLSQGGRPGSLGTDAQISVRLQHTTNENSRSTSSHICDRVRQGILISFTL